MNLPWKLGTSLIVKDGHSKGDIFVEEVTDLWIWVNNQRISKIYFVLMQKIKNNKLDTTNKLDNIKWTYF